MKSELLEKMAAMVHSGWLEEKKRQGFHHPDDCDCKNRCSFDICRTSETREGGGTCPKWNEGINKLKRKFGPCNKCHKDMKPYAELDENVKELDRVMVRQFEKNLEELGYAIGIDATK